MKATPSASDIGGHSATDDNTNQVPLWLTWTDIYPSMDKRLHPSKVWGEISYPFPNFNGGTVEVWEWLRNFIPNFIGHVIT